MGKPALDGSALTAFEKSWSSKYPTIALSWRNNWARLTPFLGFPPEIRRIVYMANTIESLNHLQALIERRHQFSCGNVKGSPAAFRSTSSQSHSLPAPDSRSSRSLRPPALL